MLIALSLAGQASKYLAGHPKVLGFVPTFYVDDESTVPTWYSSAALGLAATLLAAVGMVKWHAGHPFRFHWLGLAAIFLLLSADEIAMLHELPIDPLRNAFHTGGMLYYPWVVPALALVLVVGLMYLSFVAHLPPPVRNLVILAGFTFLLGATGVEMLSGAVAHRWGEQNLTYSMIITLEEFLEMIGVVLFIKALLLYIEGLAGGLRVEFPRTAVVESA